MAAEKQLTRGLRTEEIEREIRLRYVQGEISAKGAWKVKNTIELRGDSFFGGETKRSKFYD